MLGLAAFVITLAVGAVNTSLLSGSNLLSILASMAPVILVAMGVGIVVIAGEIDISVGALYGTLAAALGVLCSPSHLAWPVWLTVVAVIALGAAAGAINGLIVVAGRVPSIVATLATMSILKGITQLILAGEWVKDLPPGMRAIGTATPVGVPSQIWVAAAVALLATFALRRTRPGVRLYATGDNPVAARFARVPTSLIRVGAFVASGVLVGVAACVCVPQLSVVESGLGDKLELSAVTAVVVGGISMSGGRGGLPGVVAAAILLGLIPSISTYLKLGEFASHWDRAVYGLCILAAVMLDRGRHLTLAAPDSREGRQPAWRPPLVLGVVLAGLMGVAWKLEPTFVTWSAQASLLPELSMVALLAVPMTLVILTGGIDLSIGSTMALASVVAGLLTEAGTPWPIAALAAVCVGAAAGMLNGTVITRWGVHPLVVTLATLAFYGGVAAGISRGRPLPEAGGFAPAWTSLGRADVLGLPVVLIPSMLAAIVAGVWLARFTGGTHIRAVGVSETAARYAGIAVDRLKTMVYALNGAAAGLAACIFIARRNTAKADVGSGIELDVITACVLGGVSLAGGRGGIAGVVAAVLLLHEVRQFVAWRWQNDEAILFVLGGLLVASVILSNFLRRRG